MDRMKDDDLSAVLLFDDDLSAPADAKEGDRNESHV